MFKVGLFGNKWMQWAVIASLLVLLATVYVPFLNTEIFGNVPLDFVDWLAVFPLMLVPAIVAEVHKALVLRQLVRQRVAEATA